MALSDITREAVLQAMDEYDELGADEFLSRYGFAPPTVYRVAEHGRQYDSKAIVGVAHWYATGQFLTASDFSGGQQTVVKTLEALGFSFAPASADNTRAWLVTTKSDYPWTTPIRHLCVEMCWKTIGPRENDALHQSGPPGCQRAVSDEHATLADSRPLRGWAYASLNWIRPAG